MPALFPSQYGATAHLTKLLVSVAHAAEVTAAVEGGADIIDVKDPRAGALGRPSLQCLTDVVACIANEIPLTAAWGEIADATPLDEAQRKALQGVSLIKFGTAQLEKPSLANMRRYEVLRKSLPATVAVAVVHYADWHRAGGLDWEAALTLAEEVGARALVVDTHGKLAGSLFDFYPPHQLFDIIHEVRARRLEVVIAGSLSAQHLPRALSCRPAVVGVRGAACRGGQRGGPICRDQVAVLRRAIDRFSLNLPSLDASQAD